MIPTHKLQQAKRWNLHTDTLTTHPDRYQDELELRFMVEHAQGKVLNLGCGPGYETHLCALKTGYALGLDNNRTMIRIANVTYSDAYTRFTIGDALDLEPITEKYGKFDTITTRRLLINLDGWAEQKQCLDEIGKALNPDGRIIIIEASHEGYKELNTRRINLDLEPIEIKEHNQPLPLKEFNEYYKDCGLVDECNLSTYYVLTRLYYPLLREPEYNSPEAQQAHKLQIHLGDINIPSPIIMRCYTPRKLCPWCKGFGCEGCYGTGYAQTTKEASLRSTEYTGERTQ